MRESRLSRPSGTMTVCCDSQPSTEVLGYFRMSLRDRRQFSPLHVGECTRNVSFILKHLDVAVSDTTKSVARD